MKFARFVSAVSRHRINLCQTADPIQQRGLKALSHYGMIPSRGSPLGYIDYQKPGLMDQLSLTFTPMRDCLLGPKGPDLKKIMLQKNITNHENTFYDPFRNVVSYDCKFARQNPSSVNVNLNGKAKNIYGDKIWCRHLALFVRNLWQENYELGLSTSGEEKAHQEKLVDNYHQMLATVDAIESQPALRHNIYDQIDWDQVKTEIICSPENLGSALSHVAKRLPAGAQSNLIFFSTNHMMTIKVKYSETGYYGVNFFDPNYNRYHHKKLNNDLSSMASLMAEDFMDEHSLKLYQLSQSSDRGTLVVYDDLFDQTVLHDQSDISPMDVFMFFGNRDRSIEEIEAFMPLLDIESDQASFSSIVYRPQLFSATESRGISVLFRCMSKDFSESVYGYLKEVIADPLMSETEKQSILAGECAHVTALGAAMALGHEASAMTFVEAVLQTDQLQRETKVNLLHGAYCGEPGLLKAISKGETNTVESVMEMILETPMLEKTDKLALLTGSEFGIGPILNQAMIAKSDAAILAFFQKILSSPYLNSLDKQFIVSAKNRYGQSALEMALIGQEYQRAGLIIEMILRHHGFTPKEKLALFQRHQVGRDLTHEHEPISDLEFSELKELVIAQLSKEYGLSVQDQFDMLAALDGTGQASIAFMNPQDT